MSNILLYLLEQIPPVSSCQLLSLRLYDFGSSLGLLLIVSDELSNSCSNVDLLLAHLSQGCKIRMPSRFQFCDSGLQTSQVCVPIVQTGLQC